MNPIVRNKNRIYAWTRTALSWFVLFAFGMAGYAHLNEIGSSSQVLQAFAFGVIGLFLRLTVFARPGIPPARDGVKNPDDTP